MAGCTSASLPPCDWYAAGRPSCWLSQLQYSAASCQVTLTTGKPVLDAQGAVARYEVEGGSVSLDGAGHALMAEQPDAVLDALPERLALEKVVLTLTPAKRLIEAGPTKPPEPPDAAGSVGDDGRVELDLDVAGLLGELAPEADLKALKAEERAALSLRIGEMLAQRMVAQAQRGQWQLRFALNPQNLGRVEIDMQMRGGELEATLGALNPVTRELLQDALPRLREPPAGIFVDR